MQKICVPDARGAFVVFLATMLDEALLRIETSAGSDDKIFLELASTCCCSSISKASPIILSKFSSILEAETVS